MFAKSYVASSPTSLQLYHELDEVMKRCQRKPAALYKYWAVLLASQIPWATSFAWEPKVAGFPVLLGLQLVLLSWMLWVVFISLRRHAVVILRRRDEVPSFFRRNKDSLVIALISALMGGIVTLGFSKVKDIVFSAVPAVSVPTETPK
jgi:hypothetical protein